MNANQQKARRQAATARMSIVAALSVASILSASALSPAQPAAAAANTDPVVEWLDHHVTPIHDLERPGPDLAVLRRATKDAQIVGLGESQHALADVSGLKRRAVEFLIEKRGFRSLAWEDDWSLGTQINDYIHGRRDDRDALVGKMAQVNRTQQVADLLTWLRGYNRTHHDDVRFTGVEYFTTDAPAYDAVKAYVAAAAPHLLDELQPHLTQTRPIYDPDDTDPPLIRNMGEYTGWYMWSVRDKEPYLRSAREIHRIVEAVPHRAGDREHALALHHARQIGSYYTGFSLAWSEIPAYRDARAAENLRWLQRYTKDKVIYWAAAAHVADAPDVRLTVPGEPDIAMASVGSFIDDWYGEDYVRVGYTFDHGSIRSNDELVRMPPARAEWFEAPLAEVPKQRYVVDLHRRKPAQVQEWLESPMITRGDGTAGPSSTMTGSTPEDWYDVIVHTQQVSPAPLLQ